MRGPRRALLALLLAFGVVLGYGSALAELVHQGAPSWGAGWHACHHGTADGDPRAAD